jgi:HTH-type transcriptional regulator/antitoxin HigA
MARKPVRPIRNEANYEAALDEIEEYFENEPKPGTPAADRFELLALVIEDYEEKHWPIDAPDPVEAIHYRMETGGFTQADLGRLLGSRQRASDILARRRPVTLEMAWKLHRDWGIPAEALLHPQVPASPLGHRIASSAIRDVRYSAQGKKLFVTFTTGREYVYEQVPKSVFRQFENAASKGRYFNQNIRDRYPSHELLVA